MATSRLALIFDWLLFNESRNTIMDIEPCILMMHHSRRNNPALTHVLLECILRTIKEFHLPMVEDIRNEVENFSSTFSNVTVKMGGPTRRKRVVRPLCCRWTFHFRDNPLSKRRLILDS